MGGWVGQKRSGWHCSRCRSWCCRAIPAEPKTPCASPPGRCQPLSRRRQGQMAPALPQRCSRSVAGAKRLRCRRQKSVAGPFTAAAASFMPNRVLLIRDALALRCYYIGSALLHYQAVRCGEFRVLLLSERSVLFSSGPALTQRAPFRHCSSCVVPSVLFLGPRCCRLPGDTHCL